jgi:hypothetical protein
MALQLQAQTYDSVVTGAAIDPGEDGPHIYWRSDSDAVVMYFCAGEAKVQPFRVTSRLRFNGLCADSLTEYYIPVDGPEVERSSYNNVPRIFAVSDIHGEYEALVALLQQSGVIDDRMHWSWGEGHLVVVGDVFDRGDRVTECLWLIYRLEREARSAGGRVHYVFGNHELMVLRADHRYVNQGYLNGLVFETAIAYQDMFGPDMELGRWLRSKHAAVKVNDILYVHGGISPGAVDLDLSLEELNESLRRSVDVRSYELVFNDTLWFISGNNGPLWYRGYIDRPDYAAATSEQLDMVLDYYDATAMVVGHTETDEVGVLYDGRVFSVDVPFERLGTLQGLLWEEGKWYRVTGSGKLEPIG